jgi:transposase InsO family protein
VRLGRETVRRYRKAPAVTPPEALARAPIRVRGPNNAWLIDLTTVPRWLGLRSWQVLVILDAWSRLPVGITVYRAEPHASEIAAALRRAVAAHGAPRALVSDRGRVFRSTTLRRTTRRLGMRHRFGAVGQPGSIALLERFWRTLKELIDADRPALFVTDLERRLATALVYYAWLRPHAGLGGATPIERHLGLVPAHSRARPPARARPHAAAPLPFTVGYLDGDPHCPILLRRAA